MESPVKEIWLKCSQSTKQKFSFNLYREKANKLKEREKTKNRIEIGILTIFLSARYSISHYTYFCASMHVYT